MDKATKKRLKKASKTVEQNNKKGINSTMQSVALSKLRVRCEGKMK